MTSYRRPPDRLRPIENVVPPGKLGALQIGYADAQDSLSSSGLSSLSDQSSGESGNSHSGGSGTGENSDIAATTDDLLSMLVREFDAKADAAVAAAMEQNGAETKARLATIKQAAVATELECAGLAAQCADLKQSLASAQLRCETLENKLSKAQAREEEQDKRYEALALALSRNDTKMKSL